MSPGFNSSNLFSYQRLRPRTETEDDNWKIWRTNLQHEYTLISATCLRYGWSTSEGLHLRRLEIVPMGQPRLQY